MKQGFASASRTLRATAVATMSAGLIAVALRVTCRPLAPSAASTPPAPIVFLSARGWNVARIAVAEAAAPAPVSSRNALASSAPVFPPAREGSAVATAVVVVAGRAQAHRMRALPAFAPASRHARDLIAALTVAADCAAVAQGRRIPVWMAHASASRPARERSVDPMAAGALVDPAISL